MDYYLEIRPLLDFISCGDIGIVKEFDNKVFVALVDVLGHGKKAYEVALSSKEFFEENYREEDLIKIIKSFHQQIKGSRGAVVGIFIIDLKTGYLKCSGIGNISLKIFGANPVNVLFRPGIVGYSMSEPKLFSVSLNDGDVIVMHSDGVKEHFNLKEYPDILKDDAKTIVKNIMQRFGKNHDDASCIALRYKK
ncbi:MAG: SpoIIE family protein phosphatase [Acidobacteriota bacterium]|nr:SpoIIE family protein phosphatase [Acidobacteriota bacterium]